MTATAVSSQIQHPLTVSQWQHIQAKAYDPYHLLSLLERAQNDTSNAWISLATPTQIQQQWEWNVSRRSHGEELPLFGVPFAVKDNIDVEGFRTTAACPSFATKPAIADSTVVVRLKDQGAIVVGKTNLDQFAAGLVGTRSPYGAVKNAFDTERVSGGSSSGSGVVVSQGLVPFSLGTDTAGSGRVPAGFNNVIGLKPTRGALSTHGVLPACRSLDSVSIFALTLEDAELVLQLAEGLDKQDAYSRARPVESSIKETRPPMPSTDQRVMAICANPPWFGQTEHAAAYAVAISKAEKLGWRLEKIDFAPLFALASLLYEGPWVAERCAAIQSFIRTASAQEDMDPTVRNIILQADKFSAVDVFQNEYRRQDLTRQIKDIFFERTQQQPFDAILVPTTPTFPTIQNLRDEPVLANSRLGTYTNFVNFMDWSALAIPAGFREDGLPFGITLIADTWKEPVLFDLSRRWLSSSTPRLLGATNVYDNGSFKLPSHSEMMPLAVVGAHLSGLPLNKDLVEREAMFVTVASTAPCYGLFALANKSSAVAKPGLKRMCSGGASIEIEVWNMPVKHMGSFLSTIPTPLGIGSIQLQGGAWVQGFICEPVGFEDAIDITCFGGWRRYLQSLK